MPAVLTGTADVCVLVTATHHSTIAHLEKVLTPWWRPASPTRAMFTLHAFLDPRAHADLARSMPPEAHEITVTAGVAVHTTRTPQETTVLYPQLGTCVRVRHGLDVEIAGTSPHGVAVATALTVRDLTRSELEADQWRLYHSVTVPLTHGRDVPPRAWTLIKPNDDDGLWFLPHPSDTDLGLAFPQPPPAPAPADGEPQVIVGRTDTDDYLFAVLPDAPTTPAPQWLAVPGVAPPITDRHDPVRGYIDDVLHANPTFHA